MYVEFQKGKRPLICGLYGLWVHWCLHNLNIGIGSGLILPCEMTSFKWELQLLIFPHSRCYSGAVIASIVSEWNNGCIFITLQCRNGSRVIVRLLILVENWITCFLNEEKKLFEVHFKKGALYKSTVLNFQIKEICKEAFIFCLLFLFIALNPFCFLPRKSTERPEGF